MSKQKAKQSIKNRHWVLRYTLFCVGFLIILFLILLSISISREQSSVRSLNNAYNHLTLPSNWKLMNTSRIPANKVTGCAEHPDLTCPSNKYTFSTPNLIAADRGVVSLKGELVEQGFTIDGTCLREACEGYTIQAHKNDVAVRASTQKDKESYVVYLTIEKN